MLLAGLRRTHRFAEAQRGITVQWRDFQRLGRLPGQIDEIAYGVMCGASPEARTFEYMSGVRVREFAGLPQDIGRMRVPAQRYAVFEHDGPISEISRTWREIWDRWLPTSGFRSAHTPEFERYTERFDQATRTGIVEIWASIVDA
jgi:AraC family transcriptional regulator